MGTSPIFHANGKSTGTNIRNESFALGIAEGVSMATSLGVVAVADTLAPNLVKEAGHCLGKIVFLPHLEGFEKTLHFLTKLEDFQPDTSKTREQRADELGRATLLFGSSWAASMIVKLETRKLANSYFTLRDEPRLDKKWWQPWKLTNHEKVIFGMDEGIHYGSILLMNMSGSGAKVTDGMVNSIQGVLQKAGMSERKAKDIANMVVVWELPNALGFLGGVGGIMGVHHNGWDKKYGDWVASKPIKTHVQKVLDTVGIGGEHAK